MYSRSRYEGVFIAAAFLFAVFCPQLLNGVENLPAAAQQPVDFARDIQPIFTTHCVRCHGPEKQRNDLRLDSRDALLKGGEGGPAIMVGNSAKSLLIHLVSGLDPDRVMPPQGERLTAEQIGLLRAWIDQGAKWTDVPASQPAEAAASEEVDPLYELLMMDGRELFIKRRQNRMAKLPAPPAVPEISSAHNPIDRFIVAKWEEAKLPSAQQMPPVCSDSTFLRRAYLDVIGRIPTLNETKAFMEDTGPDKRERLVDQLLSRNEEYAANWTPFWEEALASTKYDVVGGIPSRGNHQEWLFNSFRENKPYDQMVAELIDPRMPNARPITFANVNGKPTQVGFILNSSHEYTLQTAAVVGQVFLGTGMKCASCHSHFENTEWPQERFTGFAGLFGDHDLELIRCEKPSGKMVPSKFAFDIPGAPKPPAKDLDARLHYLTLLLTDPFNPRFSKTIVNRLWKRYIGLGLFEPVDDFRLDTPPSHPELLEWLAYDFMKHGYDFKHTIRLILTSRTYQLRYDPALEDHFDVAKRTEPRYYRSPSLRRLTAEQLLDSVYVVKNQALPLDQRLYLKFELNALVRSLGRPVARHDISTGRPDDVAVVQALELLNGGDFHKMVYSGDKLGQLLQPLTVNEQIDTMYLSVLSRLPSDAERQLAIEFLATSGQPATAPAAEGQPDEVPTRDIMWALLCSPEYQYAF